MKCRDGLSLDVKLYESFANEELFEVHLVAVLFCLELLMVSPIAFTLWELESCGLGVYS